MIVVEALALELENTSWNTIFDGKRRSVRVDVLLHFSCSSQGLAVLHADCRSRRENKVLAVLRTIGSMRISICRNVSSSRSVGLVTILLRNFRTRSVGMVILRTDCRGSLSVLRILRSICLNVLHDLAILRTNYRRSVACWRSIRLHVVSSWAMLLSSVESRRRC